MGGGTVQRSLTEASVHTRVEPGHSLCFVVNEVDLSLRIFSLLPAIRQLPCSQAAAAPRQPEYFSFTMPVEIRLKMTSIVIPNSMAITFTMAD